MIAVGILNVTGYAGSELARILIRHPEAHITAVTGRSGAGQRLGAFFPHLAALDLTIEESLAPDAVDVVFSALPHKASAEALLPFVDAGKVAIDISADFRLRDAAEYTHWYDVEHPDPARLDDAVYGLVELDRDAIAQAKLVANPGCYPTSAILGLAPALAKDLIEPEIIIDSKSGVSGAGRGLSLKTHFSEVNESVSAYGLGGHRHLPEIAQELRRQVPEGRREDLTVSFVPHLIPMTRGILSTCYAPLRESVRGPEAGRRVREVYEAFYRDEPFVKVVPAPPQTKHTLGSNDCLIYPTTDPSGRRLIVVSCLDNLVKGAAGQAVQSMNLIFGFP
ncbi:MAG TPA: N-acetyl-gamma-glutamyl-phosphate reductase, partial [Dehalococcoidia bacterium]|nr:N-acetyl-gamma-glutamyl-phosphate reductase [Dehalococcoidia bacterium]